MLPMRRIAAVLLLCLALSAAVGCSKHDHHGHGHDVLETTANENTLPKFMSKYTDHTAALYAAVPAHAHIMVHIPCYCGCMDEEDPHDSLLDCFIHSRDGDKVTWTSHGATCGLCLTELEDIIQLAAEGKGIEDIRSFIIDKYDRS